MKLSNVSTIKGLEKKIQNIVASEESKSSKMKQLFQLGLEVKEIATLLEVRYNFVYNVISNQVIVEGLEVETTKQSSKKDQVRELFNQGKSNKEIAIELKTNYNYVYKLVKEIKSELEVKSTEESVVVNK
jgi:DNA-binding NarL/FixJ family response regulator